MNVGLMRPRYYVQHVHSDIHIICLELIFEYLQHPATFEYNGTFTIPYGLRVTL